MKVRPQPTGKIQQEFTDTLAAMGKWMQKNSSSIYGTRGNIIPPQDWGVVTGKDKTYYVHILKATGLPYVFVPGLKATILSAQQLVGGKKVRFQQQAEGVFIYLEGISLDSIDTIIQLNY